MKKLSYGIIVASMVVFFSTAALAVPNTPAAGTTNTPAAGSAPCSKTPCPATTTAQNAPLSIHLNNPLTGISTIPEAISKILSIVVRIALPFIIIFFIWSGFKFILARGNAKEIGEAKNMFFFTVIGTLLILGAWTITNAIIGTVNAIVG
ncbi:MAG: pilin [Patescibacteria group bacterium]